MQTILGLALLTLVALGILGWLVIAFSGWVSTPDPHGDKSSPPPSTAKTSSLSKPSIERSETNSMVSITVQANPHRPVVWSEEHLNGSRRLRKLTVVYEASLDASESAILRSAEFDSNGPSAPDPPVDDVDDPRWLAYVERTRAVEEALQRPT